MKLLFILLSIGLYAVSYFTSGYSPSSFSKKSLLPQMPPKSAAKKVDFAPSGDRSGDRGGIIVSFTEQLGRCSEKLRLADMIYADAASGPPSVEIPVECLDLHNALDEDDGTIDEAKILEATALSVMSFHRRIPLLQLACQRVGGRAAVELI